MEWFAPWQAQGFESAKGQIVLTFFMGSVVPTRIETDTPIILYSVMVDLQKIPDPAVSHKLTWTSKGLVQP